MPIHDKHYAHAGETAATSASWAHRSDPTRDRKISDNFAWEREIGVDPNDVSLRDPRPPVIRAKSRPGKAVVVLAGAKGAAHAFLASLMPLIATAKPRAGVEFQETIETLARNHGADVDDDHNVVFADGSRFVARQDGCMTGLAEIFHDSNRS